MRLMWILVMCFAASSVEGVLTNLTPTRFTVSDFQIASDLTGNLAAAWTVNNGSNIVLQAAYKRPGEPWQTVGTPGERAGNPNFQQYILSPIGYTVVAFQVVIDDFGTATFIWRVFNGNSMVVQTSTKTPLGPFQIQGDPLAQNNILSELGFNVSVPPSIVAGGNVTVITWQVFNGTNTVVQGTARQGTGVFPRPGNPTFQPNVLSPLLFNVSMPPFAAIDIFGNAAITWVIFNRSNTVVQAAVRPAAGPGFPAQGDPRFQGNVLSTIGFNVVTPPQVIVSGGITFISWELQRLTPVAFTELQAFTFP